MRSVPQVLVLNDCGIDQAGSAEDLKKKCNSVKELDLAQNKLENWNEVILRMKVKLISLAFMLRDRRVALTCFLCS
jgi:hypothetical protein